MTLKEAIEMNTNSRRKTSIELYRIYAAIGVLIVHMMEMNIIPGDKNIPNKIAYIVDFFFIISGFLMLRHLDNSKKKESSIEYVLHKAKSIFAPVCITNAVAFLYFCINNNVKSVKSVLDQLWHFRWEFIMMQCAGMIKDPKFNKDYLNGPAWYISALLIATFFTYGLAIHCRKLYTNIIAPFLSLTIYAFISQTYGTLNIGNGFVGPIQESVLRGVAGICVGSMCYEIYNKLNSDDRPVTLTWKLLDLFGWLSIPLWFATLAFTEDVNSIFMLILLGCALVFGFLDKTPVSHFLNNFFPDIIGWLGEYTLYIYLCHFTVGLAVIKFMADCSNMLKALVTIITSIIYSLIVYYIDKKRKTVMPVFIVCGVCFVMAFIYGII